MSCRNLANYKWHYNWHTAVLLSAPTERGRGAGAGGGGKGGNCPPNFLSQWDGYACAPLKFGNHYTRHINTFAPPPSRN